MKTSRGFPTTPRSRVKLEKAAAHTRSMLWPHLAPGAPLSKFDVLFEELEDNVLQLMGRKFTLKTDVVGTLGAGVDGETRLALGRTEAESHVTITITERAYQGLERSRGHDVFTLAHELG